MPSKATFRRAALVQRRALQANEVARHSQQLSEQLFRHFSVAEWQVLHVFLPLARRNEPDTWGIIRRIWAEKLAVRLAAPVVQPDGVSLLHYELTFTTRLQLNHWGIPEPDGSAPVPPTAFDAVLVPLLAADEAGHRVGYGGGFYERFLAACGPSTQFIGLNVLAGAPSGRIADVLPTDVPLTAYIAPDGMWRF